MRCKDTRLIDNWQLRTSGYFLFFLHIYPENSAPIYRTNSLSLFLDDFFAAIPAILYNPAWAFAASVGGQGASVGRSCLPLLQKGKS
ncbi:MAG: hypothetical protein ACOH1O_11625, partial [Flavobacterium sp.]